MSMNSFRFIKVTTWFLLIGGCGMNSLQGFVHIPLLSLAAIVPLIGQAGAKTGVKQTLGNVDAVVRYIWLFLYVMSFLVLVSLGLWIYKMCKKIVCRRRFSRVVALLHQIQADLVFLGGSALEKSQLGAVELSKKEAQDELLILLKRSFFKKKLGDHIYNRMFDGLNLLNSGKITIENQRIFLEQWLKTIDFVIR